MLPLLFTMGCRQVVRQGTLNPSLGGSNPSTPANTRTLKAYDPLSSGQGEANPRLVLL